MNNSAWSRRIEVLVPCCSLEAFELVRLKDKGSDGQEEGKTRERSRPCARHIKLYIYIDIYVSKTSFQKKRKEKKEGERGGGGNDDDY